MTTINWIRCTDRMPPDDEKVIMRTNGEVLDTPQKWKDVKYCKFRYRNSMNPYMISVNEWIPYDKATWKELNRCS